MSAIFVCASAIVTQNFLAKWPKQPRTMRNTKFNPKQFVIDDFDHDESVAVGIVISSYAMVTNESLRVYEGPTLKPPPFRGPSAVWKLEDFSSIQILREIKIGNWPL